MLGSGKHDKILPLGCNLGEILTGCPYESLQSQPENHVKVKAGRSVSAVAI